MRILFVENHAVFARTVTREFLRGHVIDQVPSVQEASRNLESKRYEVLLVDHDLDDGTGVVVVSVARRIRPEILVVGVSARDEGNQALSHAGADYLCPKTQFAGIRSVLEAEAERESCDASAALVGSMLGGISWAHSSEPGYARFFVQATQGCTYELHADKVTRTAAPADAVEWEDEFLEILGTTTVVEVRTDTEELLLRFASGHVMQRIGTWDGNRSGNNLILNSPEEAKTWADEFLLCRRLASEQAP